MPETQHKYFKIKAAVIPTKRFCCDDCMLDKLSNHCEEKWCDNKSILELKEIKEITGDEYDSLDR
jgi:hypothetical protein